MCKYEIIIQLEKEGIISLLKKKYTTTGLEVIIYKGKPVISIEQALTIALNELRKEREKQSESK